MARKKMLFTANEVAKKLGISVQRVSQYSSMAGDLVRLDPSKKNLCLVEGEDYYFSRARIYYTRSAIEKIRKRRSLTKPLKDKSLYNPLRKVQNFQNPK